MGSPEPIQTQKEKTAVSEECKHKHPDNATAWQAIKLEPSQMWTDQGPTTVGVVTLFCPYCYGVKQVAIA
jgi:hypothetical protein